MATSVQNVNFTLGICRILPYLCNFVDFNDQEKGEYVLSLLFTGCWVCI